MPRTNRLLVFFLFTLILGGSLGAVFFKDQLGFPGSGDRAAPGTAKGLTTLEAADAADRDVGALARLEPEGGVIDLGTPPGDRIGTVEVREGQAVKKGDVLVRLESYQERNADYELAETQLREARLRRQAVQRHLDAQIEEAQLREKQLDPLHDYDVQVQKAKAEALDAELANARRDRDRFRGLKKSDPEAVSQQELDKLEALVKQLEADGKAYRAMLEKLDKANQLNHQAAVANLHTLTAARDRYLQEIPLDSLEKSFNLARQRKERAEIRAPADGTVLKILMRPGEVVGGGPILRMGRTGEMNAIAEVYETDIGRVKRGQTATITSAALPKKTLRGRVTLVGGMVGKNRLLDVDPTAMTDARVVEVKIRLEDSKPVEKLVNLQVKVVIHCSKDR